MSFRVILCHDMTICHDKRFISEVLIHCCMRRVINDSVCWYLVIYKYMCPFTSRNIGQISYILCQLCVCSGKFQLSNYANTNCLNILIWTWLMSYHVKTTLCHDIMTYDISWEPTEKYMYCFSTSWSQHVRISDYNMVFVFLRFCGAMCVVKLPCLCFMSAHTPGHKS